MSLFNICLDDDIEIIVIHSCISSLLLYITENEFSCVFLYKEIVLEIIFLFEKQKQRYTLKINSWEDIRWAGKKVAQEYLLNHFAFTTGSEFEPYEIWVCLKYVYTQRNIYISYY